MLRITMLLTHKLTLNNYNNKKETMKKRREHVKVPGERAGETVKDDSRKNLCVSESTRSHYWFGL